MATAAGTSVLGYQQLIVFPASEAFVAVSFNGTVKPAEGDYTGWLRIHRFNTQAWVEVNSKPIYGQGVWMANQPSTGTHRVSVMWR